MAITLAELVYSELIGLVQRTRVSYPACFNKIRLTENMVDKRESYTKEDLLASGRGELFGAKGPQLPAPNMLMMDRVVKMTETGGNFDKGYVEAELDINPDLKGETSAMRRFLFKETESGHYYPVRHGFSPASQPL